VFNFTIGLFYQLHSIDNFLSRFSMIASCQENGLAGSSGQVRFRMQEVQGSVNVCLVVRNCIFYFYEMHNDCVWTLSRIVLFYTKITVEMQSKTTIAFAYTLSDTKT